MNWKIYTLLLIPITIIFVVLVLVLPQDKKIFALALPILFWIVYTYLTNKDPETKKQLRK